MNLKVVTVKSLRYDLSIRRTWECEQVSETPEMFICRGEFRFTVEHPHLGTIEKGAVSIEHFPIGKWYNYFAFYEVNGDLRNHYINIAMPVTIDGPSISFVDLDIDIIVWPDGRSEMVDLDELEENASRFSYPEKLRHKALTTLSTLDSEIRSGQFPFHISTKFSA